MSAVINDQVTHKSVAAVVTYILLGQTTLVGVGVLAIIFTGATVEPVMLGVLGTIIAGVTNLTTGAVGYWVGASASTKTQSPSGAQAGGGKVSLEATIEPAKESGEIVADPAAAASPDRADTP